MALQLQNYASSNHKCGLSQQQFDFMEEKIEIHH